MADLAQKVAVLPPGRCGADPGGGGAAAAGLCDQGGAGAAAVLAARHLCQRAGAGGGAVCGDDQGRRLCGDPRFFTLVFPTGTPATGPLFADLLLPAALVTLVIGAIGVLGARSLARLVAFAAIASMGTLFTAVALFTPAGNDGGAVLPDPFDPGDGGAVPGGRPGAGAARHRRSAPDPAADPAGGLIAALFFAAAIALAGMPPLSGFVGKLLILDAAREQMVPVWPRDPDHLADHHRRLCRARAARCSGRPRHPALRPIRALRAPALPFVAILGLLALLVAADRVCRAGHRPLAPDGGRALRSRPAISPPTALPGQE